MASGRAAHQNSEPLSGNLATIPTVLVWLILAARICAKTTTREVLSRELLLSP